jgi:hypothetical protein
VNDRAPVTYDLGARGVVRALVASQIREVANAGMAEADILAFWFGEPDEATPEYIRRAAVDSIGAGETFYTPNLGIPELREAIAGYVTRLRRPTTAGNVAVTSSGMNALMIAVQALVGPETASSASRRCGPTSPRSRRSWARTGDESGEGAEGRPAPDVEAALLGMARRHLDDPSCKHGVEARILSRP